MARNSTSGKKVLGLVLVVVGLGLASWGYEISGSFGSQIGKAFTGSQSDEVMIRYIGGAASFVVGLYLFLKG